MSKEEKETPEVVKPILQKIFLEHKFTDEEINQLAKQLAYENNNLDQSKSKKKSVVSEFDNKIKVSETQIMLLSRNISQGSEFRDIVCEVYMNVPKNGIKRIIRPDTEESWTEAMSDKERQERLFDEGDE